ncbi:MAG: hypothetical protein ABI885_12250 [Gammaproteobacteria bacterium]
MTTTSRPRSESRTANILRGVSALVLVMALTPLAWAAESEPSQSGTAANSGKPAAAAPAATAGKRAATKASTHAATSSSAAEKSTSGTPGAAAAPTQLVCFRMSIQCFTTANAKPAPKMVGPVAPMDLRAPEITRIFPRTELAEKLPEPAEPEVQETVEISGQREFAPVSVGLMALPWAVLHPTQAWRIFMPLPPSETK